MKYIKTFETLITLDLDESFQADIMELALSKRKILIVEELLNNGFDPNKMISGVPLLIHSFINNYHRVDIEILELIIDKGADVNMYVGTIPFMSEVIYSYDKKFDDHVFLKVFRLFLRKGANLFLNHKHYSDNWNTFDVIEDKIENKKINKNLTIKLFDIIKEEVPEQYEEYITMKKIKEDSEKYNI